MQVKKFEAVDMAGALELVKRQLGSDAVILSTRRVRKGKGTFGILGRQTVEVTAAVDPDYTSGSPNIPPPGLFSNPLQRDIEELKTMVRLLSYNDVPRILSLLPENLLRIYKQIVCNSVEGGLALEILGGVREGLSENDIKKECKVENILNRTLNRLVRVSGPVQVQEGKQRVVVFVGPTGVGKTTTIAKIAAKEALDNKRRVALITLDTYRIAAVEQLKVYAEIIGIPAEVVLHGSEIRSAVEVHRDKDLILVDTAGRSQKGKSQMSELTDLVRKESPMEVHLVLSATTKEEDLNDIWRRFRRIIPIDRLLFTKLDESSSFGTILNQAVHSRVPLSYFTTGQKVPEDIEVATVEKVLDLILI